MGDSRSDSGDAPGEVRDGSSLRREIAELAEIFKEHAEAVKQANAVRRSPGVSYGQILPLYLLIGVLTAGLFFTLWWFSEFKSVMERHLEDVAQASAKMRAKEK